MGIGPKDEIEGMIAATAYCCAQCRDGMLPTRHARGTNVRGTPRQSYSSQQAVHAPTRCCSTHSTATAARASRRSPWSTSMFILAGRPSWERLRVRHPPIHRNPRTNTMRDKLTYAPQPALRGPNAQPDPVPSASHAERPMSNARPQGGTSLLWGAQDVGAIRRRVCSTAP
jgi:hypothetical protein